MTFDINLPVVILMSWLYFYLIKFNAEWVNALFKWTWIWSFGGITSIITILSINSYLKVEEIKGYIEKIEDCVKDVKRKHSEILSAPQADDRKYINFFGTVVKAPSRESHINVSFDVAILPATMMYGKSIIAINFSWPAPGTGIGY